MSPFHRVLLRAKRSSDVVLAAVIAAILAAMIVPLPAWLLDVGLALNLAAAVTLLVAALFARDALKVASFPTLLLVTTLFRLALNVSSTRLALAEGNAGEIIQAFGEFVVRGEYVVGAVIFIILSLVQFLVVAKGAERVAEVSARFTLDGMPGKQMSIDADLRSGAMDQASARRRRRELERESQMFGAMDGAMKFVKGDVIAGLIIVLVNLVGGICIGVLQNGMELSEAATTYALIAIGDGLVSQIPSLCIAVAAGLVVTRVAGEQDGASLGAEIGAQFFGQAKALWVVGGLCIALACIPGMPHVTFLVIALGLCGLAFALSKAETVTASAPGAHTVEASPGAAAPAADAKGPSALAVGVSRLTLDLAADLTPMTQEEGGAFMGKDLNGVREQLYTQLGIRIPGIRVRTGAAYLQPGSYALLVDEVPAGRGQLAADAVYALTTPQEIAFLEVQASVATDPAGGRPLCRVPAAARPKLEAAQIPLRSARQLLCEHVVTLLRRHAADLLGVQEVQSLLEAFEAQSPSLVKEATQKVPIALLADVLRKLVQEEISIRNLRTILEALVAPTTEGDATALAEKCRQALHRYISHKYAATGPLYAYLVDPEVEESLRQRNADGTGMDPEKITAILEQAKKLAQGNKAVLLSSPDVRRTLRRLCEGVLPGLAVLTYGELDVDLQIRPMGRLALSR
jgi:type III secretion protein V